MRVIFDKTMKWVFKVLPWPCSFVPSLWEGSEQKRAVPPGAPLPACVIMKSPLVHCALAAPQATPRWALQCVSVMTVLEKRKGSFFATLPEGLPETSEITMESPRNQSPPPGVALALAAEGGPLWAGIQETEGHSVVGTQVAISLGFLSWHDQCQKHISLTVLPMYVSLPST